MKRYGKLCLAGLAAFLVIYAVAFAVAVIGTRGFFGVEPNSASALWLIMLGIPWTLLLAVLPGEGLQMFGRLFIAVAPIFNLWLLSRLCRKRRRRRN